MAKNAKFDCIEKWVKANPEYKIYEFPNDKDSRSYVVVWQTDIKKYWGFFEDGAHAFYNVSSLGKKPMKIGEWQCDGTDNFMFTSGIDAGGYPASPKAYYSKDKFVEKEIPQQPEQTTEPEATTEENPIFNCIRNHHTSEGDKITELSNKLTVIDSSIGYRIVFYTNGRFAYFETDSDGKEEFNGKGNWKCKGEREYEFTFDSENSETPTEPEADDSFPLKVGKEGPNVVKLQKFLNDKIPSNPLTVNGKFDEKTKNKLIEYQKKEGII
jgi:hypothetical protein